MELNWHGVVLSTLGVEERRDGRRVVFVARDQVRALRYEHGWRAERPILQLLFAAPLVVAGLLLSVWYGLAITGGHPMVYPRFMISGVFLLGFGVVVAALALRRGRFVRVLLNRGGSRKLLFQKPPPDSELGELVSMSEQLGYGFVPVALPVARLTAGS